MACLEAKVWSQAPTTRYHDIGREILARQAAQGWGTKVIDRLAVNLTDGRMTPAIYSP